jgi:hypothetical protein
MSGAKSRLAVVAVGRSILTDWRRIMLKLASINDARRKNMMSISGMISIRKRFRGLVRLVRPDCHLSFGRFIERNKRHRNDRDGLDARPLAQLRRLEPHQSDRQK